MLNRLPRRYPSLRELLEDIGNPHPQKVAKALGVSERTLRRWLAKGDAPKPAMFSLFWLTSWGQAAVHCEAHNSALMHAQMAASLRRRVAELEAQIDELRRIGDFGAANDPLTDAPRPAGRPIPLYRRPAPVPEKPAGRPHGMPVFLMGYR